ncbi:hypothetical protein NFI96_008574 [Prochilodus magdalenae]|nr:hypothetical protein NFI96_008574 [Prochilodus magdalenae]
MMVTKLSQCQYAVPLLVPNPFSSKIEFPLWTMRQISKSWKTTDTSGTVISKTLPVWKATTPMVAFFRIGSISSSKSQLMNRLINEKHDTFFHRNCPGSSRDCLLMDGVVEIAWYCPSGKSTDHFSDCVAFCNLHGDSSTNVAQREILTERASVNVVLLSGLDENDNNMGIVQDLCECSTPLIVVLTDEEDDNEDVVCEIGDRKYRVSLKNRNQSDVSIALRHVIQDCLLQRPGTFRLDTMTTHREIELDEHNEICQRGKEAAQGIIKFLQKEDPSTAKERYLPCQGKLWQDWCQKNKDLRWLQSDNIEGEKGRKQQEMREIRKQQHTYGFSELMGLLVQTLNSLPNSEKMYFLKWFGIQLDDFTSDSLSAIHQEYDQKWKEVLALKKKHEKGSSMNLPSKDTKTDELSAEQSNLEKISNKLSAATFGLEHMLREVGQIYEACVCGMEREKVKSLSYLPRLVAELMIYGHPIELMDGDAAHVPLIWVSAVLDELIQKLGDQRVFVLSVLGIQSSGKSTMLNAMFGLQFAVSAGRCTRGAFMQLVKVSEEMKEEVKFDYILVVDTEGLRALELAGKGTVHHDNELATFVVGLGNMTLINIFGENPTEMQDILQIAVQAFMRMKKVRLSPSCIFVHQNVTDIAATEKIMEGRRRLQDKLDEMTKLAAKDEVCDAECFSDVIAFDVQSDVRYFAQLWEGSPPMAPPNPCYSENNAHEISVYRKLEEEYEIWTWSLRSAMLSIEEKLLNRIASGKVEKAKRKLDENIQQKTIRKELDQRLVNYEKILFEKSKELALKLKESGNTIRDPKAEFDSVWGKECNLYKQICTVGDFKDYISMKKGTFGLREKSLKPEEQISIRELISKVIEQTTEKLDSFPVSLQGYSATYIQDIARDIKRLVQDFKSKDFDFKKEFLVDLSLYMCEQAEVRFAALHRKYQEANDPLIYFDKKKADYFKIFQKFCQGATSAAVLADQVCSKLKEAIQQSVYSMTAKFICGQMRGRPPFNGNRADLEKYILKSLAEQEGDKDQKFKNYLTYMYHPKTHFEDFIRDEVKKHMAAENPKAVSAIRNHIEQKQKTVISVAEKARDKVKLFKGDVKKWLDLFSSSLVDELGDTRVHLTDDVAKDVMDYDVLVDFMKTELSGATEDLKKSININNSITKLLSKAKCLWRPRISPSSHQCCLGAVRRSKPRLEFLMDVVPVQIGAVRRPKSRLEFLMDVVPVKEAEKPKEEEGTQGGMLNNIRKTKNKTEIEKVNQDVDMRMSTERTEEDRPNIGKRKTEIQQAGNEIIQKKGREVTEDTRKQQTDRTDEQEQNVRVKEIEVQLEEKEREETGRGKSKELKTSGTDVVDEAEKEANAEVNDSSSRRKAFLKKHWHGLLIGAVVGSNGVGAGVGAAAGFFASGLAGTEFEAKLGAGFSRDLRRRRWRGSQAGALRRARRRRYKPVLPSVVMGNVRSLPNKMDELTVLTPHQREYRECSVMVFTETWLTTLTPDTLVSLDGFHLIRADRTAESAVSRLQTQHPQALLLISGDFNHVSPSSTLSTFTQEPAVTRTVKKWSKDTEEALKDCFESTVWEELSGPNGEDIDSLTHCITDYVWPSPSSPKEKQRVFRSGDKDELKAVQRELRRKIREGKASYRRKHKKPDSQVAGDQNSNPFTPSTQPPCSSLSFTTAQVRNELRKIKAKKAAGPDGISARLLKSCADQLCGVVEHMFNMSLKLGRVPQLWKTSCVVPVPKTQHPKDLNSYRPVALTSHLMKSLERLVLTHLRPLVRPSMDPLQFAYQPGVGVDDAVIYLRHRALSHLEKPGGTVGITSFDFF